MPALQAALDVLRASARGHLDFNEHLLQGLVPLAPRRPARDHPTTLLKRGRHSPDATRGQDSERARHGQDASWGHRTCARVQAGASERVDFSLSGPIQDTRETWGERTEARRRPHPKNGDAGTKETGARDLSTCVTPKTRNGRRDACEVR